MRVWAISIRTGQKRAAISRYNYDGKRGWAAIFGRILVGFLAEHQNEFTGYDLITPSPTYTGPGSSRTFDHTRRIVEAAQVEEPIAWPFTYDVVIKTAATDPMVEHNWRQRKVSAEGQLRAALTVPDPAAVADKRILVDVFTEGFTIREVARALISAGAEEVSEIVLARDPGRASRRHRGRWTVPFETHHERAPHRRAASLRLGRGARARDAPAQRRAPRRGRAPRRLTSPDR